MLHNILRQNAINCVLKRRLTAVGPFSRNKSHIYWTAKIDVEKLSKGAELELYKESLKHDYLVISEVL